MRFTDFRAKNPSFLALSKNYNVTFEKVFDSRNQLTNGMFLDLSKP